MRDTESVRFKCLSTQKFKNSKTFKKKKKNNREILKAYALSIYRHKNSKIQKKSPTDTQIAFSVYQHKNSTIQKDRSTVENKSSLLLVTYNKIISSIVNSERT